MIRSYNFKKGAQKYLAILGGWTIVTMLIICVTIFSEIQAGVSPDIVGIAIYEFICISPWIISTPFILWLARTYRFDKGPYLKSVGVHLGAALFVFSFHSIVQSNAGFYFFDSLSFSWEYIIKRDFFGFLNMRVILYLDILLVVYTLDFHKKNRAVRLRKSKLKAELSKVKFHALLNQIQPGFLLGSIDAIKARLDQNVDEAEEILTDFSDLLRIMLNRVDREEVIVRQDIKSYHLYVNILSKKVDQKIQKQVDIDESCYQALIPSFLLLIPFFERVIQLDNFRSDQLTGIGYRALRNKEDITLEINIEADNLTVVEVSGIFRDIGFSEVVESLRNKYGKGISFNIKTEGEIISLRLTMPFIKGEQFIEREELFSSVLTDG